MGKGFFISGTDTGIGKTTASVFLMKQLQQQGLSVAGMKPIASGCEVSGNGLRNEDALALMAQASIDLPYDLINPFAYEEPIAPHIAAHNSGRAIDVNTIVENYRQIAAQVDIVVVEGVGGWAVPINEQQTTAHVAQALGLPVVLVTGIRLGCLNHTLLTAQAIESDGMLCSAWIANHLAPDTAYAAENINYLKKTLPFPYLGAIAYPAIQSEPYLNLLALNPDL